MSICFHPYVHDQIRDIWIVPRAVRDDPDPDAVAAPATRRRRGRPGAADDQVVLPDDHAPAARAHTGDRNPGTGHTERREKIASGHCSCDFVRPTVLRHR